LYFFSVSSSRELLSSVNTKTEICPLYEALQASCVIVAYHAALQLLAVYLLAPLAATAKAKHASPKLSVIPTKLPAFRENSEGRTGITETERNIINAEENTATLGSAQRHFRHRPTIVTSHVTNSFNG
jgi:hypothetical protein